MIQNDIESIPVVVLVKLNFISTVDTNFPHSLHQHMKSTDLFCKIGIKMVQSYRFTICVYQSCRFVKPHHIRNQRRKNHIFFFIHLIPEKHFTHQNIL